MKTDCALRDQDLVRFDICTPGLGTLSYALGDGFIGVCWSAVDFVDHDMSFKKQERSM
jgi:hypothetical protein